MFVRYEYAIRYVYDMQTAALAASFVIPIYVVSSLGGDAGDWTRISLLAMSEANNISGHFMSFA